MRSDLHRDVPRAFVDAPAPYKSGTPLNDPNSDIYKQMLAYRARFGNILHKAIAIFRNDDEDSSIDAMRLTVRSIGTLMSRYGVEQKSYANMWKGHVHVEKQVRSWKAQKSLPRSIWIRRMEIYHAGRHRLNAQRRVRSELDDLLIKDLVMLSISPFVKIRRSAQVALGSLCVSYEGTAPMVIPLVLPSLAVGTDPDMMKGALYVLGFSSLLTFALDDARFFTPYMMTLLKAQHQEKPTIQTIVGNLLDDAIDLIREPSTMMMGQQCGAGAQSTLKLLAEDLPGASVDLELRQALARGVVASREYRDKAYHALIPQLLELCQDPTTHWKYVVTTARLIRHLLRRDVATSGAVAGYMVSKIPDPQPALRGHAQIATTRLLYIIKLRTLCKGSDEALFLQNGKNPLKRWIKPDVNGGNFTQEYLDAFRKPIDDHAEEDQWMQDKSSVGWLCWGEEVAQSRLAKWDEEAFEWEEASQEAIAAMKVYVDDPAWWKSVSDNWAQEKTRTYLSGDNIDLLRSLCQIYSDLPFQHLKPVMEQLLETTDKDKQRALAEILSGILRGMKHWSGKARAGLWEWLVPRLPKIYNSIRPDTFEYWKMCFEHVLFQRDPRRVQPLVDYLLEVGRSVDYANGSAFELKKAVSMTSSLVRCFGWRFEPWADEFIDICFNQASSSDFVEVRGIVASNILCLDNVRWHPSYDSPRSFLRDCLDNPDKDIMGKQGLLMPQFKALSARLPGWRAERPSGPQASLSLYDRTAGTILRWFYSGLSDIHAPAVFSYVLPIL
jgi:proteasome activator subunit 4